MIDQQYDGEVAEVGEVRFRVLSGDDIRAMSCCEITSAELFNGNTPVTGGLYDPRMGAFDYGSRCMTCHHNNKECPGHFGHIELAAPMFNIELKSCVQKVLKCICTRCASLLLPPDDPTLAKLARRKIGNNARFTIVIDACSKIKLCHACGSRKADSITWDKRTSAAMLLTWKLDGDKPTETISMDAEQVESLFRRVPSVAANAMGVPQPAALILTALPVPPIAVRPPAKNSSGQRRDDDLTIKLCDIVKHNALLQSRIMSKASVETLTFTAILLQLHCIQYINNTTNGVAPSKVKATNRALRSVTSRLKGKEGRVRGNLCGKRVDQSARSVITPDPNISIEELGVPIRIARTLTMPETVRPDNIDRLQDYVETGPLGYPGAIFVKVASSGATVHLKRVEARRRMKLEPGDVVHRHLLDGDVVLFNRQPSLHRMSMMAHRVRVMPHDTFRLSVMVTPPYNADFDGDEMNAHAPQSAMTSNELRLLAGVASQIITPREHNPIIGVVQDVCLGIHLITHPDVVIRRKAAFNLLAHLSTFYKGATAAIASGKDTWTGREMMSELFPPTLHMPGPEVIEYGRLVDGQLTKKSYQRPTTGVIHSVYNDNGPRRAVRLLDDTQNLTCDWLVMNGFSVGIGDLIGGKGLKDQVQAEIDAARAKVDAVLVSLHDGTFRNESFMSNKEKVEAEALVALKYMFDEAGKAAINDSVDRGSRLMEMITAGSKGSKMNVCQMVASVGQQEIENGRVPLSFEGRVLPHFPRYDDSGDARGLVGSSFLKGLGPKEFFMHAMAGREGLIDTAVKSVTGDTPVVVLEDGRPKCVAIGDWIDGYLDKHARDVAHFTERQMELLDLDNDVFIPTTDENGVVTWGRVTAMTRHDPGTELYMIKTAGGRSVIVTESKSLLTWNPDRQQFKEVLTPDVRVGDFVPVTAMLPPPPTVIQSVRTSGYPQDFYLTESNGAFAGIYLATGFSRTVEEIEVCGGTGVRTFAKSWFERYGLPVAEAMSPNSEYGAVTAMSRDIATFLKVWTHDRTRVPSEAFVAPTAFVSGMLKGYFSGIGTISLNGDFDVASPFPEVTRGIAMLCSRLGIFAKLSGGKSAHTVSIQGPWLKIFENRVTIFDQSGFSNPYAFENSMGVKNDVALDEIVEISVVDVKKYPKVYDLTVPSTLNFGLANGLQVRDTSETGYIQRKLIKALEDCKVSYDRSVRMANGNVVQFLYGEDGMDACAVETQTLPSMSLLTMAELTDEYLFAKCDVDAMHGLLSAPVLTRLAQEPDATWARLEKHFRKVVEEKDFLAMSQKSAEAHSIRKVVYHPIAFDRLIVNAAKMHDPIGPVDLHPVAALDAIDTLIARMGVSANGSALPLLSAMIRAYLSPKRLVRKYRLGTKALTHLVATLERTFLSALCSPSEMVGIVAAQSLAEPLTQMVLNTFHSTGVGSATQRLSGVPRIKELMAATRNPRTPGMTVFLNTPTHESALALRDKLQETTVKDVTLSTKLIYDAGDFESAEPEDRRLVALYKAFNVSDDDSSPWLLRMVLNRSKMVDARLHMHDIHRALSQSLRVHSVHSDDGAQDLVMRLRPPALSSDMMSELGLLEDTTMGIQVSGIPDVRKAVVSEDESHWYDIVSKEWTTRKGEFYVATQGSNFAEVLALDAVDSTRTTTNDITQIFEVLGIEAARCALLNELHDGYSGDKSYVNFRHVALLVDFMVQSGMLMPIDRHGINRGDIGPLAKCSFEQPVDNLVRAAVFREHDKVHGVSASIMLGQVARCGTGDGDILLDDAAFNEIDGERASVVQKFTEASANEPALDAIIAFRMDRPQPLPDAVVSGIREKLIDMISKL